MSSSARVQPSADTPVPRLGLVLSGGGARGAYQVGVLKAIAELTSPDAPVPFRIISGTSAGAIIAAILASHARDFREGAQSLESFWRNFTVTQVFRADVGSMLRSGLRVLLALLSGGWLVPPPRSLLDNQPLRELLERHVNFARVRQALDHGDLDALAVHASAYREAVSVAFYEATGPMEAWRTDSSQGEPAELGLDHLMASAAVPFLFPPVRIGNEYFGDGAMRQMAPLSTVTALGAERLLIIGVQPQRAERRESALGFGEMPSFGQIVGYMLDGLFADELHADVARLQRSHGPAFETPPRALLIRPSADFGPIAARYANEMPAPLRILLRTLGAGRGMGGVLMSYLLFERGYTRALIELGYEDAMRQREAIQAFLCSSS
jgi:NTE family protein